MALAHDHLRRMLAGRDLDGRPYAWHHVLGAIEAICRERSEESETVLRETAVFEGRLRLDEDRGLPHAMSPEDVLRSVAVQTLGEWDRARHADVIGRAATVSDAQTVAAVARQLLAG